MIESRVIVADLEPSSFDEFAKSSGFRSVSGASGKWVKAYRIGTEERDSFFLTLSCNEKGVFAEWSIGLPSDKATVVEASGRTTRALKYLCDVAKAFEKISSRIEYDMKDLEKWAKQNSR